MPTPDSPATPPTPPARDARRAEPSRRHRSGTDGPWALSLTVSEGFLNQLAATGIGDGVEVPVFRETFPMPMLGEIELAMGMTIVGVSFEMLEGHPGRLKASIRAAGSIEILGDSAMPSMPGRAIVRGEVLVAPVIELREDGTFRAVLDLPGSELVGMVFEGFEGADTDVDTAAAVGQMLFATIGGELFEGLAHHMGMLGLDLDAETSAAFGLAGVEASPADVRVLDGQMVIGLPSIAGLEGHASPADCGVSGLGLGVADGALAEVLTVVGGLMLGVELPFDVEFVSDRRGIGGRVRNRRLVGSSLVPDLRSGLRYTLAPRLVGDHVEISVREAWVELPFVPPLVNQFNRVLGGAAGLAPLRIRLPARHQLPARPGTDETVELLVSRIEGVDGGVNATVDATF